MRILFDKPKGKLTKSLNGSFLTKFIKGFINEYGLELVCKEKFTRINKKRTRISTYKLHVIPIYNSFII